MWWEVEKMEEKVKRWRVNSYMFGPPPQALIAGSSFAIFINPYRSNSGP
jgi:hypothetical protein